MVKLSASTLYEYAYANGLRKIFPATRHAEWNDVRVPPAVADKRRIIDNIVPPGKRVDYAHSEGGEVESHKEYTNAGDTVVIIGGGRGVSAVHAARQAGSDGSVIAYEGAEKYAKIIQETAELNNVSERIKINHALVGPTIDIAGNEGDADAVSPQDLPDCDVLEMDCEGAEQNILTSMQIRPRVIIIEMHPSKYPEVTSIFDDLKQMDYDIVSQKSNEGEKLSMSDLHTILEQCKQGEAYAPIIVAVRNWNV
jgi:hypothetical protein